MRKGFSLIELMVSIGILTLMLFGVSELFSKGITASRLSEQLTIAVNIAQAQAETILSLEYQTLTVGAFESRAPVFGNFERETKITYIDPDTLNTSIADMGLKRADISVFYPVPNGEKSFRLSTIITQR